MKTQNIILKNIQEFILGIWDSFQIFNIFSIITHSSKISNNIKNCLLLNSLLFICSIFCYDYIIDPIIIYILKLTPLGYFLLIGKYFYYIFWLIPTFITCNILTTFWTDEIYYESLEIIDNNKNINVEGQDLVTNVSNQIERLLIVVCFILHIQIFNLIPGFIFLKYITMSILNSLYVFEFILLQKYIKNYKTILYFIENKFFYFLGFGILLTIIVNMINSATVQSAVYLMAFPFFLITSVKVNNIRFREEEIQMKNLRFLFFISKFYDLGIKGVNYIFNIFQNKRNNKSAKTEKTPLKQETK